MAELVPVLSWLMQRGKCRACDARIGGWQLACELGGAGVSIGALLIGGVIPGILVTLVIIGTVWVLVLIEPKAAPQGRAARRTEH